MELKDYIIKRGEDKLAKELGVSIDTIRSWRYGTRQPSVNQAKKLIKITGHALGWENIYGSVDECQ
jgi:DNA-binding XRE family transcriptional regulator|tara:strand:- start:341 stop:538 length:198 start_codon:yes stop_codon:yes gene_type:complete